MEVAFRARRSDPRRRSAIGARLRNVARRGGRIQSSDRNRILRSSKKRPPDAAASCDAAVEIAVAKGLDLGSAGGPPRRLARGAMQCSTSSCAGYKASGRNHRRNTTRFALSSLEEAQVTCVVGTGEICADAHDRTPIAENARPRARAGRGGVAGGASPVTWKSMRLFDQAAVVQDPDCARRHRELPAVGRSSAVDALDRITSSPALRQASGTATR